MSDPFWGNFCIVCELKDQIHSFASSCPRPIVEQTILSLLSGLWHPCWNSTDYTSLGLFWTLNSVPFVCLFILMPVTMPFDYCNFKFWNSEVWVFQVCSFSVLFWEFGVSYSHMNFGINLCHICRKRQLERKIEELHCPDRSI